MIEIPRAAITADKIATEAEFFSFGTNDLTQMTFGFSRDDAAKFLGDYYSKNIYEHDPFATVDQEGVGELMKIASEKGRSTRPDIRLGICGEHGGDPKTVEFCHKIGLDYVSCSPFCNNYLSFHSAVRNNGHFFIRVFYGIISLKKEYKNMKLQLTLNSLALILCCGDLIPSSLQPLNTEEWQAIEKKLKSTNKEPSMITGMSYDTLIQIIGLDAFTARKIEKRQKLLPDLFYALQNL